jgi:hypothetical protein
VDVLPCGHAALVGPSRLCRHLLGSEGGAHVRLLTGHGLDVDLCCPACDPGPDGGADPEVFTACEGCVARVEESWYAAWRGTPGLRERPEPVDRAIVDVPLTVAPVDLAAIPSERRSLWLLLTSDDQIVRLDAGTGTTTALAQATVAAEADDDPRRPPRRRLHASADGRFAAVVNDYGQHGQVIDLHTGRATLTLDGGSYHADTVPFSFAFVQDGQRTLVIHRSDWNRLDISDAATGALLTERGPTSYPAGGQRPEHYLDYFHGALRVSPAGRWLADDGWIWHPVGVPMVWDLRRWIGGDVWESEDGPSRQQLCARDYHWDSPLCWVGEDLLAVAGIGEDDEAMLDGVRVFDAATGGERASFAGPTGPLFADARRLYAAAPGGLDIWDHRTGERTGTVPGFVPVAYHPGTGELAELADGVLRRWRTPAG